MLSSLTPSPTARRPGRCRWTSTASSPLLPTPCSSRLARDFLRRVRPTNTESGDPYETTRRSCGSGFIPDQPKATGRQCRWHQHGWIVVDAQHHHAELLEQFALAAVAASASIRSARTTPCAIKRRGQTLPWVLSSPKGTAQFSVLQKTWGPILRMAPAPAIGTSRSSPVHRAAGIARHETTGQSARPASAKRKPPRRLIGQSGGLRKMWRQSCGADQHNPLSAGSCWVTC